MDKKLKVFLGVLALFTALNTFVSYQYVQFRASSAQFFNVLLADVNDRLPEIQARNAKRLADEAAKAQEKAKVTIPDAKK